MKQNSYSTVKSVRKAFKLIEVLSQKKSATTSELIKKLGWTRSNVYRFLATLLEMGYVEKDSDSKYCLSLKFFVLGNSIRGFNQFSTIAHPYMAQLSEISEENVNLAIMYENRVLYVDKIESRHYLKLDQPIGKTDPLYCTAVGKVLLSGLTELELEIFLRSESLIPFTKNAITNPEVLVGVIRNVRKQGYAIDLEELTIGVNCIACPIYDHRNKLIAAISISGPNVRLTKEKMEEMKAPLMRNTREISKKMGCTAFKRD